MIPRNRIYAVWGRESVELAQKISGVNRFDFIIEDVSQQKDQIRIFFIDLPYHSRQRNNRAGRTIMNIRNGNDPIFRFSGSDGKFGGGRHYGTEKADTTYYHAGGHTANNRFFRKSRKQFRRIAKNPPQDSFQQNQNAQCQYKIQQECRNDITDGAEKNQNRISPIDIVENTKNRYRYENAHQKISRFDSSDLKYSENRSHDEKQSDII